MATLNKVFLIGNLTRDPELRVTPKGTAIAQFGIAVNRKFKKEDGSDGEEVTFVDIEAWGKQGELVAKYLTKGSPAMIEGRLKFEQWEDKTSGKKMSKLKVVLDNVQFLSTRGGAGGEGQQQAEGQTEKPFTPPNFAQPSRAPQQPSRAPAPKQANLDEDVPF
jgi:single-strand DNA-binding protein